MPKRRPTFFASSRPKSRPSNRQCGCKTWQHQKSCRLALGTANIRRKNVDYCSTRPNKPKPKRRAAGKQRKRGKRK